MGIFFIIIFYIFGFIGTFVILTRRTFDELLPVGLMLSALICYLAGICGNMLIGYGALLIIAGISPVYLCIRVIKKQEIKVIIENIFTSGSFVFILCAIFLCIINNDRTLALWDELMQWGPFTSEMFRLDKLFASEMSNVLIHKSYYPIISIFQTELCKLLGGYDESYLFIATQILGISCLIPCLKYYTWNSLKSLYDKSVICIFTLIIMAMPLIIDTFEAQFYSSIYIDVVIGMIFGYILYFCFTMSYTGIDWVTLSISLSFLILTKDISIIFWAFIGTFLVGNFFVKRIYLKEKIKKAEFIYGFIGTVFSSLFFRSLYILFLKANNVSDSFSVNFDFKILLKVLLGLDDTKYSDVYHTFIQYIFTEPINNYAEGINFPMSYLQIMILVGGLFILLAMVFADHRKQIIWMGIYSELVALGWAFTNLNIFLFVYFRAVDKYEGDLSSYLTAYCYHRYMSTAMVGLFLLLLSIFIGYAISLGGKWKQSMLIVFVIMTVIVPNGYKYKQLFSNADILNDYRQDVDFLESYVQNGDIYIYAPDTENTAKVALYYLLLPNYYNIYENFFEKYDNYTYLYIYSLDENFIEQYMQYFENSESIQNKTIYEVMRTDNTFKLKYVNFLDE